MKKKNVIIIIAIVLCVAIVLGEVLTYTNVHRYDSDAKFSSDSVSYDVYSNGSNVYSAILLNNTSSDRTEKLYIYADENYSDNYKKACDTVSMYYIDQNYYAKELKEYLKIRGFTNVEIIDSEELVTMVSGSSSDASGLGLFILSYELPSEIYKGDPSDRLFKWIDSGGNLYWMYSEIGKFYNDGNLRVVENNQTLFFGKQCINTSSTEHATNAVDNDFRDALRLKNSGLRFGMNSEGISNSLSVGYCEDGYSSITFTKHNAGMICIIGMMNEIIMELEDAAQIIASGITYGSSIVDIDEGKVSRTTVKRSFTFDPGSDVSLYIFIGGTYTVYGRSYHD